MAYVTSATTKGGRNGRAMLDNGALALAMAAPKEIGGAGDGHNPEQLFALGYSSCYGQAIMLISKKYGLDGQAARVTCVGWIRRTAASALQSNSRFRFPAPTRKSSSNWLKKPIRSARTPRQPRATSPSS
jgi:osmotically inducible protein OsmC